jgi:hypothetical protein
MEGEYREPVKKGGQQYSELERLEENSSQS